VIRLRRKGRDATEGPASARSGFEDRLRGLLAAVAAGRVTPSEAAETLRELPFSDLGFAKVDHHRELRQGTAEIVYARGKTVDELSAIVGRLIAVNDGPFLVTRADEDHLEAVRALAGDARLSVREAPRTGAIALFRSAPSTTGLVVVVTGGTSDLPVAEEAALTAIVVGANVELISDVGVAGLHRIAAHQDRLAEADVVIVVAGMEGALASVVGGLARGPVIACPTSVGYGASFGGLAALLSMLSSCAPGVACVNIDDGVGAGYVAGLIVRQRNSGEWS
jgi:pyridinium-3,5-biscarboxylic acid mononucleotide synthase